MIVKARGTVTVPRLPASIGAVLGWCRDVNRAIQQLRDRAIVVSGGGGRGGATGSNGCPFGEIIDTPDSDPPTKSIRGGLMVCGDKNFNVPDYVIGAGDAIGLIEISLSGIDPATDDDDEIFLSGVITASGTPTWAGVTTEAGYTDTTNPTDPTGTGTIIVGIGALTVADGVVTFYPTGCGTIRVGQCAGILSYSRG